MDLSELSAPAELVTRGARVLVRRSYDFRFMLNVKPNLCHAGHRYFLCFCIQLLLLFFVLIKLHTSSFMQEISNFSSSSHVIFKCTIYYLFPVINNVSVQVADECLAPDVLSTVKEMKAVNFRRVPKMPVYGVAQPTSEVQQIPSHSLLFTLEQYFKEKLVFLHIKPYNKDIYNHIQCSTAL